MALKGSITQEQTEFMETWENVSPITNWIIRLDVRGDEQQQKVEGKGNFMLTTQERIITESKVVDDKNNPFKNGCFRPIVTPDEINIESNPNALSDEDILKIFAASEIAWSEWLQAVDSPATINRMVTLADEAETITLSRYRQLEERATEITGGPKHATQKDEETYRKMSGSASPASSSSSSSSTA